MALALSSWSAEYAVEIARAAGGAWGPWAETGRLRPLTSEQWVGPRVGRATFRYLWPSGEHFLDAQRYVGIGDRVRIVRPDLTDVTGRVIWEGIIVEPSWQWDGRLADVTFTAVSHAFRLQRDIVLFGQHRRSKAAADALPAIQNDTHYGGLPIAFNPGGRPNMRATTYATSGIYVVPNLLPAFCEPGASGASYWTWLTAFDYLQRAYNPGQAWIRNHLFTPAELERAAHPLMLTDDFTGWPLWDALAAIAAAGGCDIWERIQYSLTANGWEHHIEVTRCGKGTVLARKLQGLAAGGSLAPLDPNKTDVFSGRLALDSASCITTPTVVGGRPLYEISIELVPAWDPDDLDPDIVPPAGGDEVPLDLAENSYYAAKYCTGGEYFDFYADVGRLWLANTDGRISGQATADIAARCGLTAGSWPLARYEPLELLADGQAGKRLKPYVQIAFDGGTNWRTIEQAAVLADELGCRITAKDLRQVKAAPIGGAVDPSAVNLWEYLGSANLKLRLVCCVASPHRAISRPERRGGAGCQFNQTAWIDRGDRFQPRYRCTSSPRYEAGNPPAGASDGTVDGRTIAHEAAAAQQIAEARLMHADLPTERIDPDITPTMVIEKIAGVEFPLGTNAGPRWHFPRIVCVRTNYENDSQSLTLDSAREAYVR